MVRQHNTRHAPSSGPARYLNPQGDQAPRELPAQDQTPEEKAHAAGWSKGQLLNVRNQGEYYNVTLQGEEYDPTHPERCLQFQSTSDVQSFVSRWYSPDTGGRPPWA
jgi:hypothetical protein